MIPQQNVPGLQRVASRQCVACGAPADAFCARCGLVPYCGMQCQRTDWVNRHRSVCHNLARFNEELEVKPKQIETVPPPKPLRQPHTQPSREPTKGEDTAFDPKNSHHGGPKANKIQSARNPNQPRRPMKNDNNFDSKPATDYQESKPNDRFNKSKKSIPEDTNNYAQDTASPGNSGTQNMRQLDTSGFKVKPEVSKTDMVKSGMGSLDIAKSSPSKSMTNVSNPENKTLKQLGTVSDVTPVRKVTPKMYFVETLSIGDVLMLSVEGTAKGCNSKRPGHICLSLHEKGEADYQKLCEDYTVECSALTETYMPNPGDTFSFSNPEDGAYYRARCLNPTTAALLDSGKLATFKPEHCKRLTGQYENIPEFCCQLDAGELQLGDNLKCTLLEKIGDCYKVVLENAMSGAAVGSGQLFRWVPTVEYPQTPLPVVVPEIPRPNLINNAKVLLVEASSLDRIFLRPADAESMMKYDSILHDVIQYGLKAKPLLEPPKMGDYVVGKFTDGNNYRALCKRTSVKLNKYLLEYVEYGNMEKTSLQEIQPCPPELSPAKQPTVVSMAVMKMDVSGLTPAATEYLEKLRDDCTELVLTIPNGATTAASGSEVVLTVEKNRECVNKKVLEMCMPEWKKLEKQTGKSAVPESVMFSELKHLELPANGGELCVLDIEMLESGSLSVCPANHPHIQYIMNTLTEQMEEYCNSELGSEPYLPKHEEMCIAKFPPYPQWFRAVVCGHSAGSTTAQVCYVDFGNLGEVPVALLRRIPPEFVRGVPALAALLEIGDFPKNVTQEMLARAVGYMKIDEEGKGVLTVASCKKEGDGQYLATAPDLLKAMRG